MFPCLKVKCQYPIFLNLILLCMLLYFPNISSLIRKIQFNLESFKLLCCLEVFFLVTAYIESTFLTIQSTLPRHSISIRLSRAAFSILFNLITDSGS